MKKTSSKSPLLIVDTMPRGAFLITINEPGTDPVYIKGRFSMLALDKFCEQKQIPTFLDLISKITLGMTIKDYAQLVFVAIQDYYREDYAQCPWTADRVMEDIFDIPGFSDPELMKLFRHAIGRVADLVPDKKKAAQP